MCDLLKFTHEVTRVARYRRWATTACITERVDCTPKKQRAYTYLHLVPDQAADSCFKSVDHTANDYASGTNRRFHSVQWYGATPLQPPRSTLPVEGIDAASESRVPGDFLNDVDELLRVVPGVQEDSGGDLYQLQGGGAVAGVVAMMARDNPLMADAAVGEKAHGNRLVTAGKKRRCGTVCLAGTATQRGFCASSISQR